MQYQEFAKKQEGFLSQLFMVLKKDGDQRPIMNLKKLNSFVQTEHFKMEGIQRPPKVMRLDDKSRPEGWLLHDTSNDRPQEVAAVQVARRNLPVQLPALRVVVGSVGLYQDYKADCSHPQDNGPENDHLHR